MVDIAIQTKVVRIGPTERSPVIPDKLLAHGVVDEDPFEIFTPLNEDERLFLYFRGNKYIVHIKDIVEGIQQKLA